MIQCNEKQREMKIYTTIISNLLNFSKRPYFLHAFQTPLAAPNASGELSPRHLTATQSPPPPSPPHFRCLVPPASTS